MSKYYALVTTGTMVDLGFFPNDDALERAAALAPPDLVVIISDAQLEQWQREIVLNESARAIFAVDMRRHLQCLGEFDNEDQALVVLPPNSTVFCLLTQEEVQRFPKQALGAST